MANRYWYKSRPPGIGCQPDGFTAREGGLPKKDWTTSDGDTVYAFGWVEYETPLTFEQAWLKDLVPDDTIERAYFSIWLYADRNEDKAAWLTKSYIKLTTPELEEVKDHDVMARAILAIRKAGTKEKSI